MTFCPIKIVTFCPVTFFPVTFCPYTDSLNDRKIIGCRKNILSIFVALLTFYKFIIKKKKKKISHFKMQTLNSDVTVNSYNNLYMFSMK